MIYTLLPHGETLCTKAASAVDFDRCELPFLHGWRHCATMHQPQMLTEMVLPIESSGIDSLLLALMVVVRLKMFVIGI